jgi:hypothetical protein
MMIPHPSWVRLRRSKSRFESCDLWPGDSGTGRVPPDPFAPSASWAHLKTFPVKIVKKCFRGHRKRNRGAAELLFDERGRPDALRGPSPARSFALTWTGSPASSGRARRTNRGAEHVGGEGLGPSPRPRRPVADRGAGRAAEPGAARAGPRWAARRAWFSSREGIAAAQRRTVFGVALTSAVGAGEVLEGELAVAAAEERWSRSRWSSMVGVVHLFEGVRVDWGS